jgi:hypothetical protein
MGTLCEDVSTFMTISHWILIRVRNVSNKSHRENQNIHTYSITFFQKLWCLWGNIEKYGGARGCRWQYGCMLHAGSVMLHFHKHTLVPVHPCPPSTFAPPSNMHSMYKVVQIWPGLIVCKRVTVCRGHIWTTLYLRMLPPTHKHKNM